MPRDLKTDVSYILGLAEDATPETLAELDAKAAKLQEELAAVTMLRGLVATRLGKAHAGTEAGTAGPPLKRDTRRPALLHLLARSPMRHGEIMKALGLRAASLASALDHPWFEKTSNYGHAPYRLSEAGRTEYERRCKPPADAPPSTSPDATG